jgi:short-subunit dehydrogenase
VVNMTLPADMTREQAAGAPARMMDPNRAARVIVDGVARNRAMIVFPASMRWAWRALRLFPRLADRRLLQQMRRDRTYRTAELVSG